MTHCNPLCRTINPDIPTFEDKKMGACTSSCEFGSQGGFRAFCLKMCDFLAQQDEFSTTLRSILVVCKVRNKCILA